jgi:hypothetical protein
LKSPHPCYRRLVVVVVAAALEPFGCVPNGVSGCAGCDEPPSSFADLVPTTHIVSDEYAPIRRYATGRCVAGVKDWSNRD